MHNLLILTPYNDDINNNLCISNEFKLNLELIQRISMYFLVIE